MGINDEMAAEPKWGGGGWQCEGEDGMGGIAPRFAYQGERFYHEAPERPRHTHFTPPRHSATEEKPRSRSSESVERARQARILRRRNGR